MKLETKVWLQCESVGRPETLLKMNGTVRECLGAQAQWLMGVYMGAKIRIVYARDEAGLASDRRSAANKDIMADLESILSQGGTPNEEELDRELESEPLACEHGNAPNQCSQCKIREAM